MTEIIREPYIADKIVIVDGLTGTGKTMMGPFMGSFTNVELGRFEFHLEYYLILHFLGKLEKDACKSMIGMITDLDLYNMVIAREINFRPTDLSGAFTNPKTFQYLKRLLSKDGESAARYIQETKPIMHFITHQISGTLQPAIDQLGSRLKVIEMVRHPYYLLDHWYSYIDRHGTDPRDFTIWLKYNNSALPWFCFGWEKLYYESASFDRVILSIESLVKDSVKTKSTLGNNVKNTFLTIPFEKFVLGPSPYINMVETFLDTKSTRTTYSVLKSQKVPRTQLLDGPAKSIYKKYAWTKPDKNVSDKADFEIKKKNAFNRTTSKAAKDSLERMAADYEKNYGLWF